MKEKIKVKLDSIKNHMKGPCFRIYCDDKMLVEYLDYQKESYEGVFELDLAKGSHRLIIEHFNKSPKDTINGMDVATQLTDISFNGIKCDQVDLHENYFHTADWPYEVEDRIKNNLYFGYNGKYVYEFECPATSYVLEQKKRHQKNLTDVEHFEITEQQFIDRLEQYMKSESH